MLRLLLSASVLGTAVLAAACSAPAEDIRTEESKLEGVTCAPEVTAAYDQALAGARLRESSEGSCEEGTTVFEIAPAVVAAADACPALRDHFANSAEAAPLRKALEKSLLRGIIDGRIQIDAAGDVVFAQLTAMLSSGVTFYGRPHDLGNLSKMTFGAAGKLVVDRYIYSEDGATDGWQQFEGTWRIEQSLVIVTVDGKTTNFALLHPWTIWDFGLEFTLTPESETEESFSTFPNECSA